MGVLALSSGLSSKFRFAESNYLRILVYLVIYDSGQVSLEHLLLSWYPTLSLLINTFAEMSFAPRAQGSRSRVGLPALRVWGAGLRSLGFRCRIHLGLGIRDSGCRFRV